MTRITVKESDFVDENLGECCFCGGGTTWSGGYHVTINDDSWLVCGEECAGCLEIVVERYGDGND